jgi:hypothetical protein
MKRATEINVFGVGRVSRRAVATAARQHPDVHFRLFSRAPHRHRRLPCPNVHLEGLDGLTKNDSPLVLCMASQERRVLRKLLSRRPGPVLRTAVAASNLRLLRRALNPELWCNRLVVVVTNPVELVCQFLYRATGNPRIYGFGMGPDRERVEEALQYGLGLPPGPASGIEVNGFHCLRPIPCLGNAPGLLEQLELVPAEEVVKNLARHLPATVAEQLFGALPLQPRAHELVLAAVNAITASEFQGAGPPVRRGSAHLARCLSAIITGGRVAVSGRARPLEELFLGGRLDLADGTFRVPDLGPAERGLLDDDVAELRRLEREHLG